MAKIEFRNIKHTYKKNKDNLEDQDFVLKNINLTCRNGGAYALLGPSGCGKTTLLNVTSGLTIPYEGSVLFNGKDVSRLSPSIRNIAQVFQFPVIYDTMTVRENLVFPLKNRRINRQEISKRVQTVSHMLGLDKSLNQKAKGLSADQKQKLSLGRGLVRSDVNLMMFDEPLTVIDPHLKWELRAKLKELHREFKFSMMYVTHDQTEALTFAEEVIVMHDGVIVQIGTPKELFECPEHVFVGNFIGSPGMNFFPCELYNEKIIINRTFSIVNSFSYSNLDIQNKKLRLGVRPEFIYFHKNGFPVQIIRSLDIGSYSIIKAQLGEHIFNMIIPEGTEIPTDNIKVKFHPDYTYIYADGWRLKGTKK